MQTDKKISLALLGATGTVGQKFIKLIEHDTMFEVKELVASEKSIGKTFQEAVLWREEGVIPENLKKIKIIDYTEIKSSYAISCLPTDQASIMEPYLTAKGIHVISNASTFRMNALVPLLIPEINATQIELIKKQNTPGKLITNPNCAVVFACMGIKPFLELGLIEKIDVVTLQAISGAGYPGVSSFDILGDIIPYIDNEEKKVEEEIIKILFNSEEETSCKVMAHVNRVPVLHGHTTIVHLHFKECVDENKLTNILDSIEKDNCDYIALYRDNKEIFTPRRNIGNLDQRAHLGRIKLSKDKMTLGFVSMGHNLVRGAAGAAYLNLKLIYKYLN